MFSEKNLKTLSAEGHIAFQKGEKPMDALDVTMITWYPLPAPPDRYLLARFRQEDGLTMTCEVATDRNGQFLNVDGTELPEVELFDAWAYLPYDY